MVKLGVESDGHPLVVDDAFDSDSELKFLIPGFATAYLPVDDVRSLRDHLNKVLGEFDG